MADADGIVLGYVVCASVTEAQKISDALVKEKLVACTNVVPAVQSTFFWQGELESVREVLLFCKTLQRKMPAVEARIKALHSHDVPCICFYPAVHVNAEYASWVRQSVE